MTIVEHKRYRVGRSISFAKERCFAIDVKRKEVIEVIPIEYCENKRHILAAYKTGNWWAVGKFRYYTVQRLSNLKKLAEKMKGWNK